MAKHYNDVVQKLKLNNFVVYYRCKLSIALALILSLLFFHILKGENQKCSLAI